MLEQTNERAFEGRYKTLFEGVNAAAFLTSFDGKIIEANLRSCDLLGYGWNELTQLSLKEVFPETHDWDQFIDEISAKGGLNFESENIRKDGSIFPVEISASIFTLNKKPVMISLIWDITERKEAEQKLRDSEEKYRCIFENSAVAIMLTDERERIVSWNKYTETIFGYGEDELCKKPVSMLYPPEEWKKIRSENVREKGMQHNLETRMFKKDNTLIDVDISITVLKDESGEVCGSIGIIKDITERVQAERKLKESEEKYSGLFECTTDGMVVLDARGEILDVNTRTLDLFSISEDEMLGNNFLSMGLLTPKSLSIVVNQFQELLSKKIATSQETEVIDKNGVILNVELSSFFLVKRDNEIDNFVLLIRDVSDRKQTEIKLACEHTLLQTLMDSIPDSIYFKDEENKFVKVNKAKAAHYNVKPEEMFGKTDFDFLSESEARQAFDDDDEVLKTGKFIINKVEKLTNIDGSMRWVSVTKIPRFDSEGNIIGTMGISRDITEWKRLEEMYKKDKTQ